MGRVSVLGSLNRDLVLHLDRLPAPGETLTAGGSSEQAGGKGANQAAAAARAGAATRMVGAVGEDPAATVVLSRLRREGVDVTAVRPVADAPTGLAVVSVAADGENSIVVVAGANGEVDDREVAACRTADTDVLLCQLEVPLAAVVEACATARSAGTLVVLNAAPADPAALGLLRDVDVLVVNEHEALLLGGGDDPRQAAHALSETHAAVVVVTLGGDGAVAFSPGRPPVGCAAPAVDVVDTTGAGDAFVGFLAAGLAAGDDLEACLAEAVVAGALAVTRPGALDSVPRRAELAGLPAPAVRPVPAG